MKIAVASKGALVSEHFGHCENFNFFEIVDGELKSEKMVESPGHDCQGLPKFLKENGIEILISGGMGRGAVLGCENLGIEVVVGATGDAKESAIKFEKGELHSTGALCSHNHEHGHHHK